MKIPGINLRNKFRRFLVKKSDRKIARLNVLIVQKGIKIIKAVTQEPFADYRITKKRSLCHETGRN